MADGLFALSVVTPEERLVDATARSLVLRSSDGDLTVLDGHTALVTDVVSGEVRIEPDEGEVVRLAVHGGYMQVETGPDLAEDEGGDRPAAGGRSTRVTVLAGVAERAEQIDVSRAERAREEAAARVQELQAGAGRGAAAAPDAGEPSVAPADLDLSEAESALRRAELRLEVAGAGT